MTYSQRLVIVLSALLVTACATNHTEVQPEQHWDRVYLNQSPELSKGLDVQQQYWWYGFEDEQLNALVARVQEQNINLKMAQQRITAARSYQQAVESFKVPTVSLGAGVASYGLSKNDPLLGPVFDLQDSNAGQQLSQMMGGDLLSQNNDAFFLGASVSWELDVFGKIDNYAQAAALQAEQVEIVREGVLIAVSAEVVQNYLQFRGAQKRLKIADENISDQRKTLDIAQSLAENGLASDIDVTRAKALLATTQANRYAIEAAQKVHLHRLAMLVAESPTQLADLYNDVDLPAYKASVPLGLPSELLLNRPDLQLTFSQIAIRDELLAAQIAQGYPSFYLTGGPGLLSGDFGDLFQSNSFTWGAALGVKWDIFDGGRQDALQQIADTQVKTSVLMHQQAYQAAVTEVETLLIAYGNGYKFYQSIREANIQGQRALQRARELYQAGLIDYLAVLDAQRQVNQLSDAMIIAELQQAHTVVLLHKALGGDWNINSLPNV
ncbi:TolC family protein [Alginatibacterium sediminis]|uniref:TolC family protein n=1 Tax=Alginatibacterium sediminis TaxID=2164068 RepID=A0A420EL31_9ALTE|nr:TolC family protein [Alginatibacterium sediminis]RKF21405.1 TolC family protein [Alginatibacterium sediminis]